MDQLNQIPLKARLEITGRAGTYDDMLSQVTLIASRFFGTYRWKILSYDVDTLTAVRPDGTMDVLDFPYTAMIAGPTS
jgi:hypothetical protein